MARPKTRELAGFERWRTTAFRRWLGTKLGMTRWPRVAVADRVAEEKLAELLGVSASLLREVRAGRFEAVDGPGLATGRAYKLHIALPEPVRREWLEHCEGRRVTPTTMLRSLVHHFLLGRHVPARKGPRTFLRGRQYSQSRAQPRTFCWITPGAARALEVKARQYHARPSGVARGMVLELLEGKIGRVPLIDLDNMWDDERRYLGTEA